ncbi:MAG: radical SAM protein [Acidobacteriota bacterium]
MNKGSAVYGPVTSWRVGRSLGIDLLCIDSICSFNCTYCQLGFIQVRTRQRALFVPTRKVLDDLKKSDWQSADIITFSGSGEPTLALNLGEAIGEIRSLTAMPILVLTNGSLLDQPEVRRELAGADRVYVKLDAATERTFQLVNRPVGGLTLQKIVGSTVEFRRQFPGYLGIQCMFLRNNLEEFEALIPLLNRIRPDEVQINSPTRPYPQSWVLSSRGSHDGVDYPAKPLKPLSHEEGDRIAQRLEEATGLKIVWQAEAQRR